MSIGRAEQARFLRMLADHVEQGTLDDFEWSARLERRQAAPLEITEHWVRWRSTLHTLVELVDDVFHQVRAAHHQWHLERSEAEQARRLRTLFRDWYAWEGEDLLGEPVIKPRKKRAEAARRYGMSESTARAHTEGKLRECKDARARYFLLKKMLS